MREEALTDDDDTTHDDGDAVHQKYCGKIQKRYALNILKAWYGNPKQLWSVTDGIDVTAIVRKKVNKTTNELHLYPDEDVELYYHILFGVKVDPTAKEEEKVYELILKYRYDDAVTGEEGTEEECHSHIVADDKFSLDIMYTKIDQPQCFSREGTAMIRYEDDVNNCILPKKKMKKPIIANNDRKENEEAVKRKIKMAHLGKIQKQLNHLTYQLHDIHRGFNKTRFIPYKEFPRKEPGHEIDRSQEWVTLAEQVCFGPNIPDKLGTFRSVELIEHVVEFKLTVLNTFAGKQLQNGITCDAHKTQGLFTCNDLNDGVVQVILTKMDNEIIGRAKRPEKPIIAPPENTRIRNYNGHGQAFKWLGSCSDCHELIMGANIFYTFERGHDYQLLFSSSFDKLYSDSNRYEGQTCVKLEAHQCPLCQKIKTYKIMDNPELPMSVNGVNLPGKE